MCKQHPDLTNELSCHDPAPPETLIFMTRITLNTKYDSILRIIITIINHSWYLRERIILANLDYFVAILCTFWRSFYRPRKCCRCIQIDKYHVWSLSLLSPVDGGGPWLAVVTPAQDLIFTLRMSDKRVEYCLSGVGGEILIITIQMSDKRVELNCLSANYCHWDVR